MVGDGRASEAARLPVRPDGERGGTVTAGSTANREEAEERASGPEVVYPGPRGALNRAVLRVGAITSVVATIAMALVALLGRDATMARLVPSGGVGAVVAWWEMRRGAENPVIPYIVWALLVGGAYGMVPPSAMSAPTAVLVVLAVVAGLTLEDPVDKRFMIVVWTAWGAQFAWMLAPGRRAVALSAPAILLEALALVVATMLTGLIKGQLLATYRRFRNLYDNVPVGLFQSTPDGDILAANETLARMLGFPDVPAMLQVNARALYANPGDRDEALVALGRGEGPGDVVYPLVHREGRQLWVRETARAVHEPGGEVLFYEGAMEDITEEVLATRSAQAAEERFAVAFESAPIGMALVSMHGRFLRVNRAFCELLGHDPEALTDMGWRDIVPPDDEQLSVDPVRAMQPGDSLDMERRYLTAGGEGRWGRVSLSMVPGEADGPYLVAQLADITARKEAQDHLEDLVRAKDEFVASVSHELRTPLTAVVGLTSELVARCDRFSEEEVKELLGMAAEQASTVAHIVEDLLVAARADIGQLTVLPEYLDLRSEIEQSVRECEHLRQERGALVTIVGPPAGAWADGTRVRQVVRNLLTNAYRYGGGNVEVRVQGSDGRALVEVSDDGAGIPADEQEAIFHPYHRAHTAPTLPGSIGLGLAVSKKLAVLMGGDLTYRYAEGRSIFGMALPGAPLAV